MHDLAYIKKINENPEAYYKSRPNPAGSSNYGSLSKPEKSNEKRN